MITKLIFFCCILFFSIFAVSKRNASVIFFDIFFLRKRKKEAMKINYTTWNCHWNISLILAYYQAKICLNFFIQLGLSLANWSYRCHIKLKLFSIASRSNCFRKPKHHILRIQRVIQCVLLRALVRNFNPRVPLIKGIKILQVPGNFSPRIS